MKLLSKKINPIWSAVPTGLGTTSATHSLASLPDTFSGADFAAVPHPAGGKAVSSCLLGLASVFGACCKFLCGIVGKCGHNVTCMAEAVISCVKVWGVLLAFC